MKERQKEIFTNLVCSSVFLIASIITITFLATGDFSNWVEYQIIIALGAVLIFFMIFFFFTFLHHIFRKD